MLERRLSSILIPVAAMIGGSFLCSSLTLGIGDKINPTATFYFPTQRGENVLEDNFQHTISTNGLEFPNHIAPIIMGTDSGVNLGLINLKNICMVDLGVRLKVGPVNTQVSLNKDELHQAINFILAKTQESC